MMGARLRIVSCLIALLVLTQSFVLAAPTKALPVLSERLVKPSMAAGATRPGRLIVGLQGDSALFAKSRGGGAQSLAARWNVAGRVEQLFGSESFLLETNATTDLDELATTIAQDREVAYVEPDYIYRSFLTPNDEFYPQLYALPRIQAPQAWDITTGSANVMVAVVDSGVYGGHPDLRQNVVGGTDFVNGDGDAADDNGHGTHTAGIIAAVGNNGRGVTGVCWQCKILPVKSLDHEGGGSSVEVSAGIRYAADRGAKVINLSLGGENNSRLLHDAVIYATNRGALMIVAAGNEAMDGNPVEYPAAYPEVVAVGANDGFGGHAPFSNYHDYVDISAPGIEIGSTLWVQGEDEVYALASGTSEAAPFVSGVAALLWSLNPSLTNEQVRQLLLSTADDLGTPGRDIYFGVGQVNAFRAVQAALPQTAPTPTPEPSPVPQPSPTPQPGDVLTFPETGYTLRGEFRRFWEANGGLPVFGYPITEEFVEQTDDGPFLVQYFERNRLELHPDKPAPYNVLLGRLSDTLLQRSGVNWWALPKASPQPNCEFFAETGHTLCEPFLSYWRGHGLQDGRLDRFGRSLALFGMPLTEPHMATNSSGDTVMTQWFERARFEEHRTATGGSNVLLGLLGNEIRMTDAPTLQPTPPVPGPVPSPTPASRCPEIPPSQNGVARPQPCLALGEDMVLDALGFEPGEQIAFWLTAPDEQVFGGQRTITAGDDGTLRDLRYPTGDLTNGRWYWVFQGTKSGHQAIVFYHLYRP